VFSWVLDHAQEYGLDADHVFAVGDSAGAHLLGLFSNLCTNPAYAQKLPVKAPAGFAPKAVALNCGQYHTELNDPEELTAKLMAEYLPEHGTDEELDLIEAVGYATESFPPSYVMTCEADFLHDQAAPLAQRLRELEVSHELHIYCGVGDKLGHVFHLNMKSADARRCNDDECYFFRRFL
jgi:acetyl esterase/lipase